MGCNCDEIREKRNRLERLTSQAERLSGHANAQMEIEDNITSLKKYIWLCMESPACYETDCRLYSIADDMESVRSQIKRKMNEKISAMEAELHRLRIEDDMWHDEQEKIARNAALVQYKF